MKPSLADMGPIPSDDDMPPEGSSNDGASDSSGAEEKLGLFLDAIGVPRPSDMKLAVDAFAEAQEAVDED